MPLHRERHPPAGSPLEYLIRLMNDTEAEPARRDRAAISLLPYTHPRLSDVRLSQKTLAQEAAQALDENSEWARLLKN